MRPTILLVEDDENDMLFIQTALNKVGVTCPLHTLTNGRDALEYVNGTGSFSDREKYPIAYLALLDLKLPYVTGLEILKQIRQRPEFDSTMVLVLTSSKDPKDIDTAYRLKANAYLVKPSGMDSMRALARSVNDFWLTQNQRPSVFT